MFRQNVESDIITEKSFMRYCRDINDDKRKCEFCSLRFKCYTENWGNNAETTHQYVFKKEFEEMLSRMKRYQKQYGSKNKQV